ncbi:MAG: hypothetical protein N2169_07310, partial [bacterium]|nr:hypothetical protein [bacterium]
IWVCTQLVEASLDIDFDYLFTEASTADSLIQRMGRVWRHRSYDYSGDENIIIAKDIKYRIYEKILVEKSIEMIQGKLAEGFLLSQSKREIVKELYSEKNLNEWGSKYLSEWEKYEKIINSEWNFILKESKQRAFRDVMTIELIPEIYKNKICCYLKLMEKIIEKIKLDKNLEEKEKEVKIRFKKTKILKKIQEYKVPVPIYLVNPSVLKRIIDSSNPIDSNPIEWLDKNYEIGILNKKYEYNIGLGLTGEAIEAEEESDISNNII